MQIIIQVATPFRRPPKKEKHGCQVGANIEQPLGYVSASWSLVGPFGGSLGAKAASMQILSQSWLSF